MIASPSRILRFLLLATTLLVAQWVLGQHESQIEPHATHASCEWCLSHAPLTGSLPSVGVPPVAPAGVFVLAARASESFNSTAVRPYASRAPPRTPAV